MDGEVERGLNDGDWEGLRHGFVFRNMKYIMMRLSNWNDMQPLTWRFKRCFFDRIAMGRNQEQVGSCRKRLFKSNMNNISVLDFPIDLENLWCGRVVHLIYRFSSNLTSLRWNSSFKPTQTNIRNKNINISKMFENINEQIAIPWNLNNFHQHM